MKNSDYIILELNQNEVNNDSKMEEIGIKHEEFIEKKNKVWGASYQGYKKIGDNKYQFNYMLQRTE